ncbi:hypothetical protein MERGE_001863 [Pneumocystis wakefieldiae]|uniref:Coatomer subunit gamma n=1 Tax=Pneumocystis wakefieldiae TaxID=38082 RepID=A0A899FWZ7_9ASCO|nr:hypothetical protein MERGE_001863 [Pneumocystis wakefieldiae]
MNFLKKDEDSEHIFHHIDKTAVLQEARIFNKSPINPRVCRVLLMKIAYLLHTGDHFATRDATELFFGITKLFQHKDEALRQMVYVIIKELARTAEIIIMITSSVIKDTTVNLDAIYRPNAIRSLSRIVDATTVPTVERIIKTAIIDKLPFVSSAGLISSYHLFSIAKDIIRKWSNEIFEAFSLKPSANLSIIPYLTSVNNRQNQSFITQYHALGLLYLIRNHDRMAVMKMVQRFCNYHNKGSSYGSIQLKSNLAVIMLVRYIAKVIEDDQSQRFNMFKLLEEFLHYKNDMVNIEAAKIILQMRDVTDDEALPAVTSLRVFLSSPRTVCRFAAIRILNRFAVTKPHLVGCCNSDIESLISYTNKSIATFAITTLLKTGNEVNIDKLMKQIQGFMSDITDEFKIIVIDAIRSSCLKFPSKQAVMLSFLNSALRDEGGYDFKNSVVEALFDMIKFIPESKEDALSSLCEFIEDCEFTKLTIRILHTLGIEGPRINQSTKYIRYIYNRIVLENALVRAAAVSALSKFGQGLNNSDLKISIKTLLKRCLEDSDDEVRDRAVLNIRFLEDDSISDIFKNNNAFSFSALEHQLVSYISSNSFEKQFDTSSIPIISKEEMDSESYRQKITELDSMSTLTEAAQQLSLPNNFSEDVMPQYSNILQSISEFKDFGPLLKSTSKPIELTESGIEYCVTAVKHIFKEHIVLQFNLVNTLSDAILENISMLSEPDDPSLKQEFIIEAPKAEHNSSVPIYVSFLKEDPDFFVTTTFTNVLKFITKEIDPSTGEAEKVGYEDEYQIEALELSPGDYISPIYINNFSQLWDSLTDKNEVIEMFSLSSITSLQDACCKISEQLSMQPIEGTGSVVNLSFHIMKLSGKSTNGITVLAVAKLVFSKNEITLKLSVRSENKLVSTLVTNGIA